jgi:diguanylate cyclase (GGDEF)-like protein/PAS domain S-box-containing protein
MTFKRKIALMPSLAALAFVLIIVMTYWAGLRSEGVTLRLEQGYAPALLLGRDLEDCLARLQRGLQDAVASADVAQLAETDQLSRAFLLRLEAGRDNVVLAAPEVEEIRAAFVRYYSLARGASARMIQGEAGEGLTATLESMRTEYNSLRDKLQAFTRIQEQGMQQAFVDARRTHHTSLASITGITVLFLLVLVGLSAVMIRSLLLELSLANRMAESLAAGLPAGPVEVVSGGEIGQLLLRMKHMVERVEERTQELTREIGERRRAEEALRDSEERYALAARGANDGLWDWDLRTGQIYFSPRWKAMLGFEDAEIAGRPSEWLDRIMADDLPAVQATLDAHLLGTTQHFESEHRLCHKDGSWRWVLSRGIAVRDREGRAYRVAGSQTDITVRKHTEEQLLHDAFHDALTGLPNRPLLLDRLGHCLTRARRREGHGFAVLFIDLDRFKLVNDSLGHIAGDRLLVEVARTLKDSLRPGDTVARLGGDEFAVLLDDIDGVQETTAIVARIQSELAAPVAIGGGNEVFATASIGIALGSREYAQPEEVVRDADIAMYHAKGLGKSRYAVFDAAMHLGAVSRLQMETDLRHALDRQEFRVFYQPIVCLATGRLTGFEALLRWDRGERGLMEPSKFIPVAEETGLILPIGEWVLREAYRRVSAWMAEFPGRAPRSVSVNLSSRQLAQSGLPEEIARMLREYPAPRPVLHLEVTEGTIIENGEAAEAMLRELKELNVKVDVDDFGTGYSSLSYLHRLPIDNLKIDQSFVRRIGSKGENAEIVRTIVSLAHTLGLEVTAEGVEREEQLEVLRSLGCHHGQGLLFSAPLEDAGVRELICRQ